MMKYSILVLFITFIFLNPMGCTPGGSTNNSNNNNTNNVSGPCEDEDSDTICDIEEGRDTNRDTDGDGTPDYLDTDSDNDDIPDSVEAGDSDSNTPPLDSDFDNTPDYIDQDSDGNGIADYTEGTGDLDGDGVADYADLDNDGDYIIDAVEIGDASSGVPDSDNDSVPDYNDTDSDGDGIGDIYETSHDADNDGIENYRDTDSDGDGILDSIEGGTNGNIQSVPIDSDNDGHYDFLDADSDNDGLADNLEDVNHNGIVDPGESDPHNGDSDGDGASDLIEVGAGTDPLNGDDNPQNNGDFVFVMPYEEPASPTEDTLDFATDLSKADLYFLVDVSGSMADVMANIKTNMQTTISNAMGQIPDLQVGIGTFLYAECTQQTRIFEHRLDIQANATTAQNTFPSYSSTYEDCGGGFSEPPHSAMYLAATGYGSSEASSHGVTVPGGIPNETSCSNAPGVCAAGYTGYPCFRPGALPIIALVTDEGFAQYTSTSQTDAIGALNNIGAKTIGIWGFSTWEYAGRDAMNIFMAAQGSVDINGTPLVYEGANGNASTSITDAILALSMVPMDISSIAQDNDDGTDAFGQTDTTNVVAEFIDFLESTEIGTNCTTGWIQTDSDGDSYQDTFLQVSPGNNVCWDIHVKNNITVPSTAYPQLFTATIYVYGDNITEVDHRTVYFLVPPHIEGPGIEGK
jgi:hypothetical protein